MTTTDSQLLEHFTVLCEKVGTVTLSGKRLNVLQILRAYNEQFPASEGAVLRAIYDTFKQELNGAQTQYNDGETVTMPYTLSAVVILIAMKEYGTGIDLIQFVGLIKQLDHATYTRLLNFCVDYCQNDKVSLTHFLASCIEHEALQIKYKVCKSCQCYDKTLRLSSCCDKQVCRQCCPDNLGPLWCRDCSGDMSLGAMLRRSVQTILERGPDKMLDVSGLSHFYSKVWQAFSELDTRRFGDLTPIVCSMHEDSVRAAYWSSVEDKVDETCSSLVPVFKAMMMVYCAINATDIDKHALNFIQQFGMLGSKMLKEFQELSSRYFAAQAAGIHFTVELNLTMDRMISFVQERTCVRCKAFKKDISKSTKCCLNPICDVCYPIHHFLSKAPPCESCAARREASRLFGGDGGAGN